MNNGIHLDEKRPDLSASDRLKQMKPPAQKERFLIAWNPELRILKFGCGYAEYAVTIDSSRKLGKGFCLDNVPAKLPKECVERLLRKPTKVDGRQLLGRCVNLLRSYLHMRDERLYMLLAVWAIGTYLYPVFSHYGYMFLYSVQPRSGKTRTQELLSHLCFEATTPLNAPTVPTIRDTAAEGHTLILDTLERWNEKSTESFGAAMELLDAGFRNGGTVVKMVAQSEGGWKKESFPVFAPYVLAAIRKQSLTDTALDRSFVIEMHRKPIKVKKNKYSFHDCETACVYLRGEFYQWALENANGLSQIYNCTAMESLVNSLELNDRASDIWRPLLAVARALGREDVVTSLGTLAIEMHRDPEADDRTRVRQIARSLRTLTAGKGQYIGMTSEICTQLRETGEGLPEANVSDFLSQWAFGQKNVRHGSESPRRRWVLEDARLAEIEAANAPLVSPSESATTVTTEDSFAVRRPALGERDGCLSEAAKTS